MLDQMLKGIDRKRLTITVLVVFVYVWVSDFIIHGLILGDTYRETAHLWRTEEEMKGYMIWMLLGQFLIAKYLVVLFARGYEGGGAKEGLRFGLLMGLYSVAPFFIQYAVTPLPTSLLWGWVMLGFIQVVLGSTLAGAVYKKKQ